MKIVIATRSRSAELYEKASSFWPEEIPRERIVGMNDWRDAIHYLHACLNIDADYVVNCDEDCFVFDWSVVEEIIRFMAQYHFPYAGMPDTAENCSHRNNGAHVHNPFFTVFKPKVLQNILTDTDWYANAVLLNTNPEGCPHHEVFNNFYEAISYETLCLDIQGKDHADGISTELSVDGKSFALHSWYSREYENDGPHRERIDVLYQEACTRKPQIENQKP